MKLPRKGLNFSCYGMQKLNPALPCPQFLLMPLSFMRGNEVAKKRVVFSCYAMQKFRV